MQSTTFPNYPANIIEEVKSWFHNWAELNRRAVSVTSSDPDAKLSYIIILLWIVVGICIAVCTAFGVTYHYAVFKSVSNSSLIGIIAASLFLLLVEITTVLLSLYLFDAIFEKMWFRNMKRFTLVAGLGVMVFFAIRWSIHISTEGIAELNKQQKVEKAYQDTRFQMPPEVIQIDSELAKADSIINVATKSTWKTKPTKEGLDLLQANTELKKDLNRQKEAILLSSMSLQDSIFSHKSGEATYTSTLLTDYGGKAEYAKLLSLFFISLIGSIIREKNQKEENVYKKQPTKADTDLMDDPEESEEIGFSAIASRLRKSPPLPPAEKRGRPEYTHFRTSARVAEKREEPKRIRIVEEVVEDVEKNVIELCGKIQKFYPSRWEKTEARGGKLSTMATNFHSFLQEIEELLQENPQTKLSGKWKKRVEEYRQIFTKQIKSHL